MTILNATIKKNLIGALAALALSGSVRADDQDQTTARELSKSLGNMPVILASPERGSERDQCLTHQLQSLAKTLRDMSLEERRQIEEQLRVAGVRSLEIKGSSRANQEKILGERVLLRSDPLNWETDTASCTWVRIRDEKDEAGGEFFSGFSSLTHNQAIDFLEKVIVDRAKLNQNSHRLNRGNLVIQPKFNAYVLINKEISVSYRAFPKIRNFAELENVLAIGSHTGLSVSRTPKSSEFLTACFSPVSLGDIVSSVESPVQK
jgi:hypothetical protein